MDEMMNDMVREIKDLKQYKQKSAQQIETTNTTIVLTYDLELFLDRFFIEHIRSDMHALITIQPANNNEFLSAVYFDVSNFEGRSPIVLRDYDPDTGVAQYQIAIEDFDFTANNDYTTLSGGGSVQLNYDVVLTTTTPVTVSVTYEDLWQD